MKELNLVGLNYKPSGLSKQTSKISQILSYIGLEHNIPDITTNSNILNDNHNIISLNPYHLRNYSNLLSCGSGNNIGVWTWETLDFPKEFKKYEEYFDKILVLSEFNRKSISDILDINVEVIKLPFECHGYRNYDLYDINSNHIPKYEKNKCLFICDKKSNLMRKGVKDLMSSFRRIQKYNTDNNININDKEIRSQTLSSTLTLKILGYQNYNFDFDIDDPVRIIGKEMTEEEMITLYKSHDIYTSLHTGEGFAFTIMEAMSCGIPTIVTSFGGNMDYCNSENSFLIDFKLFESQDQNFPGRMAKPNYNQFETIIQNFDTNLANIKSKKAYEMVKTQYDISSCSKIFLKINEDFLNKTE